MDSARPYNEAEFLDAERGMGKAALQALERYKVAPNAMFMKLSDMRMVVLGGAAGAVRDSPAWPMQFGLSCCALELREFGAPQTEWGKRRRFIFRGDPRQCDVMVVAGWVAKSMAPTIRKLYDQMAKPRHVIAYGGCAASGGPWWQSYNIMQGIDEILPVDVYVVGCPPKPENLLAAMIKLQDKVGGKIAGSAERSVSENIRREKAGRV